LKNLKLSVCVQAKARLSLHFCQSWHNSRKTNRRGDPKKLNGKGRPPKNSYQIATPPKDSRNNLLLNISCDCRKIKNIVHLNHKTVRLKNLSWKMKNQGQY